MDRDAQRILDLWYPDTGFTKDDESFGKWISERMYGGMDTVICEEFADVTTAAARGDYDHWAETAKGTLALLLALDQFPRSLWRNTPGAYAQDIKANRLVLGAVENGQFSSLEPWEQMFFIIALGHCEGPDHLDRVALIETLAEETIAKLPPQLAHLSEAFRNQNARLRSVVERFGRHPHRNPHYGRVSSPEEEEYIAAGDFPHVKKQDQN